MEVEAEYKEGINLHNLQEHLCFSPKQDNLKVTSYCCALASQGSPATRGFLLALVFFSFLKQ